MKRIAVTGGKGGTGKSTVACALAVELGKRNKVLLVDADAGCPNDHLLLGIKRERISKVNQRIPEWDFEKCVSCGKCAKACKYNAIVTIEGKKPLFIPGQCNGCGACETICPQEAISWESKPVGYISEGNGYGIELLSGELKPREPLSELVVSSLKETIEKKGKKFDYLIIDTAAGTHCDVISALMGSDLALCVAEATPLGKHDLELIIKLVERLGIDFEIALNKAGEGKDALIEAIAKKDGKKIAAKIPYSKGIIKSYCKGKPVESQAIEKMTVSLE